MAVQSSPIPRSHSPALPPLPSPTNSNCESSGCSSARLTVDSLLNLLKEKTEFFPFLIDHDNFEQSSLELLKLVFPNWFPSSDPLKHLKLTLCTEGITNKLMKCKNLATGQVVLIRAYGKKSELIIDRQAELLTFAALQEDGLAPPLHGRFENGFIYGYVRGIPLKAAQLSDQKYWTLIARKIARWHRVDCVPGDRSPRLFRTLWKWFRNIPKSYKRPDLHAKFHKSFDMTFLESELAFLEIRAKSLNCPIVFCHNDLLAANIIFNPELDDVTFIDYEYGSFNYRSFDIANHFCEFAGFDCDYSLYPNETFRRQWIREYLINSDEDFSDQSVSRVFEEVDVFSLVANFFWVIWALVQSQVSEINFDYMSYAVLRFSEYKKMRAQLKN